MKKWHSILSNEIWCMILNHVDLKCIRIIMLLNKKITGLIHDKMLIEKYVKHNLKNIGQKYSYFSEGPYNLEYLTNSKNFFSFVGKKSII